MAIVDRHGLPLAVTTHAANHHEVTLVQLTFDFYMIEAKPQNLIGDRAYDSVVVLVDNGRFHSNCRRWYGPRWNICCE
jgi:hypothetical protein